MIELTPKQQIDGIRRRCHLGPDAMIGITSDFGKKAQIEGDGRTLDMIANTNRIDLQKEVVVPSGNDLAKCYFACNGKVFGDHKYGLLDTIGIKRSIEPVLDMKGIQYGWRVRVYMMPNNEIADAVIALAEDDGCGCSIGFQAIDYGSPTPDEAKAYSTTKGAPDSVVRKWNWLELSMTAFPCNVDCQTLKSEESVDRGKSILDSLVCKGRITRNAAAALGLVEAAKNIARKPVVIRL